MSGEVIDLPLGTAMALTAIPDPDNETLDEQHLRINSALAAEMQQHEFQKAAEMQKANGTSSVRFFFVLFWFVFSCTHDIFCLQVAEQHIRIGNCLAAEQQLQELQEASASSSV